MAVSVVLSPNPVVHSAAYDVMVQGMTPGHTVALWTNTTAAASSVATGTVDANGNYGTSITASATTGLWFLNVIDTQGGNVCVAQVVFTAT